jgi:arylsulfatase A-like enzyme
MKSLCRGFLPLLASFLMQWHAAGADRPNIVWITAEDMSPTLGCYGDSFATSPHIDRLASHSTRYTHAFATAPVCSPSRACLINGLIATSQGTHPMRSLFPLPPQMKGFPAVIRAAGYFTTNSVKTDYNSAAEPFIKQASWDVCSDQAHWRSRKDDQPFFSVFNLMTSHQSRTMVWPYAQFQEEVQSKLTAADVHDPAKVPLPPYYPDTPLVRKTQARYYDCVAVMDQQVGEILQQLADDGLAENTIVFFYSDHGSGMPRHKRALYDSGMHVPLLIRFPQKYSQLSPTQPGETTDRLVTFEDFGPTVLSLLGLELPSYMRGQPFLGPLSSEPRTYAFGHRDRVDEIMDTSRSVRSNQYLYIRNYLPHLGWNQQSAWIDQGEVRKDFYALADSGKTTPAQAQYLNPRRPREELYDCQADPNNLANLADSSKHRAILKEMRDALREHLLESRDLGFIPEIELWQRTGQTTPWDWSRKADWNLAGVIEAAELVGTSAFVDINDCLRSDDAAIRYWGAVACSAAKENLPDASIRLLETSLADQSVAVQIEAANALARHGHQQESYRTLVDLIQRDDETVVLHAARTIELLGDRAHLEPMQRLADRFAEEPSDLAWFIRFTTSGYLSRQR